MLFKDKLNKNRAYFDKKLRWGMGEMDELFCLHLKRGGRDKLLRCNHLLEKRVFILTFYFVLTIL